MALIDSSNAIYLSIGEGKITRRVKEPTGRSRERINKNGVTVHEEHYPAVEGIITDISVKDGDYGKQWIVKLEDDGDEYQLQMPYSSGYSASFLKALPNVDLSKKVRLTPKLTIEGDKKRTTLFIKQEGKAVKWAFTKENPQGIPQLRQIKVKGVTQWDDTDVMEFLENVVQEQIKTKLKGEQVPETESDDNLPF